MEEEEIYTFITGSSNGGMISFIRQQSSLTTDEILRKRERRKKWCEEIKSFKSKPNCQPGRREGRAVSINTTTFTTTTTTTTGSTN